MASFATNLNPESRLGSTHTTVATLAAGSVQSTNAGPILSHSQIPGLPLVKLEDYNLDESQYCPEITISS